MSTGNFGGGGRGRRGPFCRENEPFFDENAFLVKAHLFPGFPKGGFCEGGKSQ